MALPALVLVHGGGLAADSWELTVEEIRRLAPDLTVLALDLPGRRNKPGDLREMTIADYVDSLVDDIESAGLEDIVIVGHSIGSMPLPGHPTRGRHAHVHSVGRRHACRLGKRLHASGSRGRQGNRGNHLATGPLAYLPRNCRWLREGTRELVRATTQPVSEL
jgi:hypothetical protein